MTGPPTRGVAGVAWAPTLRAGLITLAGLSIVAALIRVIGQVDRPLWVDEASTFWTSRETIRELVRQIGTDGTPPLYFLLVKTFAHVFGTSELALRLPSLVAGLSLVPVLYFVGRAVTNARTGLIAAALAAISPLLAHYSVEARNYSVLSLETAVIAVVCLRAVATPTLWKWWLLLSLVDTLQLWTHLYAVFLVPFTCVACLIMAPPRERWLVGLRATAAAALAFCVCSPWLLMSWTAARAGVGDWIAPLWTDLPPSAAVLKSLEVFGFGASFPAYLWFLADAPSAAVLSFGLTLAVFGLTLLGGSRDDEMSGRRVWALAALLVLPLIAAWSWSLAVQPLYLPGRYDTIVLPIFIVLFAVGIDRAWQWRLWAGAGVSVMVAVLAAMSLSTIFDSTSLPPGYLLDSTAGQRLARVAVSGDLVVATGLRRQVAAYYASRTGFQASVTTFPTEVNEHPGWESQSRMLGDPDRLRRDGEALTSQMVDTARHGHRVWLLPSAPTPVNDFLFRPLFSVMRPEDGLTFQDAGLVGLRLR